MFIQDLIARKSVHNTEFIKLCVSNLLGTVGRLQPGTAVERSFTPVLNITNLQNHGRVLMGEF